MLVDIRWKNFIFYKFHFFLFIPLPGSLCICCIGGFLEVTLVWIHPIHQNLCRTQWPRVGNDIDSRDNGFVYGYVTLPLKQSVDENIQGVS